jgi:hypothetical protein
MKMAIALMMEAVQTSETSVNSYQSTRRYNPEDSQSSSYYKMLTFARKKQIVSTSKRMYYVNQKHCWHGKWDGELHSTAHAFSSAALPFYF